MRKRLGKKKESAFLAVIHNGSIPIWFWGILFGVYLLFYLSYIYGDIIATTAHGMNVWNALLAGDIFQFTAYSSTPLYSSSSALYTEPINCVYLFPVYLMFALWNIPTWIADRFLGINVFTNFIFLLWVKGILIVFLAMTAVAFCKLAKACKLGKESSASSLFLFLSSLYIMTSLLHISQYDIISLYFTVSAIVVYLEKGVTWKCLLLFSIAAMFKLFAVFVIIPLLLLREKRIGRLLVQALLVFVPSGFFYLIKTVGLMRSPSSNTAAVDFTSGLGLWQLLANKLPLSYSGVGVSLFVLLFAFICAWSYISKVSEGKELAQKAIWCCAVAMGAFFISTTAFPYWLILITPYLAIIPFFNTQKSRNSILFCMVSSVCMVFAQMFYYFWCYGPTTFSDMLWSYLLAPPEQMVRPMGLADFVVNGPEFIGVPIFLAGFVAGLVVVLILNYPSRAEISSAAAGEEDRGHLRNMLLGNMLVNSAVAMLPILIYVFSFLLYGVK